MTKSANDNMASLHLIRNEASNWGNWVVSNILVNTNCMDITMACNIRLARMWRRVWVVCTAHYFLLGP